MDKWPMSTCVHCSASWEGNPTILMASQGSHQKHYHSAPFCSMWEEARKIKINCSLTGRLNFELNILPTIWHTFPERPCMFLPTWVISCPFCHLWHGNLWGSRAVVHRCVYVFCGETPTMFDTRAGRWPVDDEKLTDVMDDRYKCQEKIHNVRVRLSPYLCQTKSPYIGIYSSIQI